MKKAIIAVLLCASTLAFGAPDTTITNYFPGYILVTNGFADAGDTGLTVSNAYAAFLISDIDRLTEAQAAKDGAGSSVSDLIRAIVKEAYDQIQATDSTNRPTKLEINKSISTSSGTADYTEKFVVESEIEDSDSGSKVEDE